MQKYNKIVKNRKCDVVGQIKGHNETTLACKPCFEHLCPTLSTTYLKIKCAASEQLVSLTIIKIKHVFKQHLQRPLTCITSLRLFLSLQSCTTLSGS